MTQKKDKRKRKKRKFQKDDVTVIDSDIAKKSVVTTALGNAMEWFDFGIYSYLVVIIGQVFYSGIDDSAQLVFSFGTFAVAFLVRPIGGMFFGMLGDRLGRKKNLGYHIDHDGYCNIQHRTDPKLRFHRNYSADPAAMCKIGTGIFHGRRICWSDDLHC